jgi:hypothetical protein
LKAGGFLKEQMVSEASQCPVCGIALPAGAPRGLCPACLLRRGLETNTVGASAWVPPTVEELAPRFPELEIRRLIGRGGMGAVYEARQKHLDRVVALKILPPELAHDAGFADRFAREAQAMARLNHANIVVIHEFGTRTATSPMVNSVEACGETGLYFFLMEYVDGMNLRQLLASGHVTPKEALAIVPQICDALQYAHDQGIVHRDIKPENILLNRHGQVKIADFGLAKLISPTAPRDMEKIMGTAHYMAPEQRSRPAEVDHRADIYSLGVVFYQLLTGELPKGEFVPPSKQVVVDVRLDEIVLRALEQSPELRFQNATELKTQVETVMRSVPVRQPVVARAEHVVPSQGVTPFATTFAVFQRRVRFSLILVPIFAQTLLILLNYWISGRPREFGDIFLPWLLIMLVVAVATFSVFYFSLRARKATTPLRAALLLFVLALPFVFSLTTTPARDPLSTYPIAFQVLFAAIYVPILAIAGVLQIMAGNGEQSPREQRSRIPVFRPIPFTIALSVHSIGMCVILAFLLFYVSRTLEIFRQFGAALPAFTGLVIDLTRGVQEHGFLSIAMCLCLAILDALMLWALQQPRRQVFFWLWFAFVLCMQILFLVTSLIALWLPSFRMIDLIKS